VNGDLDPRWESKLRRAANNIERWTATRDRIIAAAVAAGRPLRGIAAAAGITHAGVAKIAKRELNARAEANPAPEEKDA
jgi:hypothetical protein